MNFEAKFTCVNCAQEYDRPAYLITLQGREPIEVCEVCLDELTALFFVEEPKREE